MNSILWRQALRCAFLKFLLANDTLFWEILWSPRIANLTRGECRLGASEYPQKLKDNAKVDPASWIFGFSPFNPVEMYRIPQATRVPMKIDFFISIVSILIWLMILRMHFNQLIPNLSKDYLLCCYVAQTTLSKNSVHMEHWSFQSR